MKTKLLTHPNARSFLNRNYNSFLDNRPSKIAKNGDYQIFTTSLSEDDKMDLVVEGQSSELSLDEFCRSKGVELKVFSEWTDQLINSETELLTNDSKESTTEEVIGNLVTEVLNGELSVAELCRRESISTGTFRKLSREFLNQKDVSLSTNSFIADYFLTKTKGNEQNAVLDFLSSYVNWDTNDVCFVEDCKECLDKVKSSRTDTVISSYKLNDIRYINKHLEGLNENLKVGDLYIGCFETLTARKKRLRISRLPILNNLYFGFEFFFLRMAPKIKGFQKLYFSLTKGRGRILSKAEALGRLVCCGFQIVDHQSIGGITYFVVRKAGKPVYDMSPSFGPVYAMPRVGLNGKIIKVYKLRTMHPYSEYLQEYIVKSNGYADTGKPANDFRIPVWGKFIRKFWLDELPQLINVFKGEMKLVGIRPLSEVRFNEIPKEMKKLRLPNKPGCIPPYISLDRDSDVISLLQAEKDYIEERSHNPKSTDIKYLFLALYNIIFKNKRSA